MRVVPLVAASIVLSTALSLWVASTSASGAAGPRNASANVRDAVGDNGQSFDQAPTDVVQVAVRWSVDSLTIAFTYKQDPPSLKFAMVLTDRAANDLSAVDSCALNEADTLQIMATAAGKATLTQGYITGSVESDVSLSGTTATYVFSNPALTAFITRGNDPFTCVSGNADGDRYYGAFAGKTVRMTSLNATAALRKALAAHFRAKFTAAARKWVTCPSQELIPATGTQAAFAACAFEFGRPGGLYYGGYTSMFLADGRIEAVDYLNKITSTYRKRLQTCAIPATRSGWVNGVVLSARVLSNSDSLGEGKRCSNLIGPAGMASDIESEVALHPGRRLKTFVVGIHGTNQAGFEAKATFRCRVSASGQRQQFDCRNHLGDRFVYGFAVSRP